MIRLYTPAPFALPKQIPLSDNQHHYLLHVMRQKPGDTLHIFNGMDGLWLANIAQLDKKQAVLQLQTQLTPQQDESPLILAFAPIKQRLESIIEKGTELGVTAFQPLITTRTVVHHFKPEKLLAHAIEAAEQCERLTIPSILPGLPLADYLHTFPTTHTLFHADETGSGKPIQTALQSASKPVFLIGPEGGFTPEEIYAITQVKNSIPFGMGRRILRADTAAFAALSCWQAIQGDWHHAPRFQSPVSKSLTTHLTNH